jgi:hypothetical protein
MSGLSIREMLGVTFVSASWRTIARREALWRSICATVFVDFTAPRRACTRSPAAYSVAVVAACPRILANTRGVHTHRD